MRRAQRWKFPNQNQALTQKQSRPHQINLPAPILSLSAPNSWDTSDAILLPTDNPHARLSVPRHCLRTFKLCYQNQIQPAATFHPAPYPSSVHLDWQRQQTTKLLSHSDLPRGKFLSINRFSAPRYRACTWSTLRNSMTDSPLLHGESLSLPRHYSCYPNELKVINQRRHGFLFLMSNCFRWHWSIP